MTNTAASISLRWILTCSFCTAFLMVLAFVEIQRIADGKLFAFSFAWEQGPSPVEIIDAQMSANTYKIPAMLSLAMICSVVGIAAPSVLVHPNDWTITWRLLVIIFLLASLGDLATTVWFFHVQGVDYELHPGIRLFGYAYGRTVGAVAGKIIQAVGVLCISLLLRRWRTTLLVVVTIMYSVAAVYNASQRL